MRRFLILTLALVGLASACDERGCFERILRDGTVITECR